jgi:5-carboxymethyl-2-hydroxymuconic-semialdehyde dehydrogenase
VFEDADLDLALENMLEQYDNSGQVCLSGTRILIHESIADTMIERMHAKALQLKQGNPLEHDTKVGPLIHPEHLERVDGFVQRALQTGGEVGLWWKAQPQL